MQARSCFFQILRILMGQVPSRGYSIWIFPRPPFLWQRILHVQRSFPWSLQVNSSAAFGAEKGLACKKSTHWYLIQQPTTAGAAPLEYAEDYQCNPQYNQDRPHCEQNHCTAWYASGGMEQDTNNGQKHPAPAEIEPFFRQRTVHLRHPFRLITPKSTSVRTGGR